MTKTLFIACILSVGVLQSESKAGFQYFVNNAISGVDLGNSTAKRTSDGLELFQTVWTLQGDRYIGLSKRLNVLDIFPAPTKVSEIGTYYRSINPACSADGLILVFGSERPSPPLYAANSMWISTRPDRASRFFYPTLIADFDYYSVFPESLSPDGLSLWFYDGTADRDGIRHTTRSSTDRPFVAPETIHLPNLNGKEGTDALTDDELTIFVDVYKGSYVYEVYVANRATKTAAFGPAVPLPYPLNRDEIDENPYILIRA